MSTDKRGFSLVELMIVIGIMGGISLITLNLTKQTSTSSSKYQFDMDVDTITNEINGILSSPSICLASLSSGGSNIALPTNINFNYYSVGNAQAPASGYGNGGVVIKQYDFSTSPYPSNDGFLKITFNKKNIMKGAATITKNINLYIEQNASGVISGCRSLSTSTTTIWSRGSGTSINYIGGNVGIGTPAPTTPLDIAGVAQSTQLDVANGVTAANLTISPGGIVSNGMIESKSGGIKFPDGTTQSKSLEGKTCSVGQYLSGINSNGLVCSNIPLLPPINCSGSFSGCSASCGYGTETYYVSTFSQYGGTTCPFQNGYSRSCFQGPCPVNCAGYWGLCSKTCGGDGKRKFTITTNQEGSGTPCPASPEFCNPQSCVIGGGSCSNSGSVMNTKLPKNNCSQSCGGPPPNSDGCPYTWTHWGVAQYGWLCTSGKAIKTYDNHAPYTAGGAFTCNQDP